ncbi:MAG: SUMF1/EgtB/PvdO family nonheme iron enzyme, partial [Candidatus Cloacimonadaceae bacterium]|nr:SUMF1/EgtB/PvdO family nonheme iron enzyme [Candidatus Cloacimonadaceae bacterium]
IGKKLLTATIAIRKQGLNITQLALTGIMITDDGELKILSSGITYEEVDEREDVFNIGVLLAQLLSKNTMYKSIYSPERLQQQKFTYINGATISLNKLLAECLHRNILQRYSSLSGILSGFENLPPVDGDSIWTSKEKSNPLVMEAANEVPKPKSHIEYGFWILIGVILALLFLLLTTNLGRIVLGGKSEEFKFVNIFAQQDSVITAPPVSNPGFQRDGNPALTEYGELKAGSNIAATDGFRVDPRLNAGITPQATTPTQASPGRAAKSMPANMVFIESDTFGFGRLKENLNHNVSQSGFYISKHELTQGDWNKFMMPANVSTAGDNFPVDNISWINIITYCNGRSQAEGLEPAYKIRGSGASLVVTCDFRANGYRLPTEAEWELAAKAGQLTNYSGSDYPEDVAWFRDNSAGKLRTPGGKQANDNGLYDMTGNVSEWCWDWFDTNYLRTLPTFINPTGPETGTQKVIRGGNVMNGEGRNLNIIWREKGDPSRGYQFVGFRLVRTH